MISLEEIKRRIKVGETYKYTVLCTILEEEQKKHNSRKAQLKDWACFFEWEKVTDQKMKIVNIYDDVLEREDKRKNNGGHREGAGRKKVFEEEFNWLINAFLHQEYSRNVYNGQKELKVAYFSNSKIAKYFGLYSDNLYAGKENDAEGFGKVNKKLIEKRNSWIIGKIKKDERFKYGHGILAYKDREDWNSFDVKDEWLDKWEEYKKEYEKLNETNTSKIIEEDKWEDMEDFISEKFEDYGYARVCKVNKVSYEVDALEEYEINEYAYWRMRVNGLAADAVIKSLDKKGYDAREFVDMYVRF